MIAKEPNHETIEIFTSFNDTLIEDEPKINPSQIFC
jgi:hypothetical protein